VPVPIAQGGIIELLFIPKTIPDGMDAELDPPELPGFPPVADKYEPKLEVPPGDPGEFTKPVPPDPTVTETVPPGVKPET
jgi:hypothetical protein